MSKERISEKLQAYVKAYKEPPYGREVNGTVELLEETAKKLAEYEDLEELNLLLRLPCKVGDAVYIIVDGFILKSICLGFEMRNNDWRVVCSNTGYSVTYEHFEDVFLTQPEAEAKLKELES